MDHLRRLIEHLAWADERVLGSLRNCRTPLPAAISLYSHILGAEHHWLSRLTDERPTILVWPDMSLEECEQLARENANGFKKLATDLKPEDLNRQVTYRNTAGVEFTNGVEDMLMHVAMHGSYHRGQVAALLRSAGDEPIPTDYIQWVRGVGAPKPSRG